MQVSVENIGNLSRRVRVSVPDQKVAQNIRERMIKLQKEAHLKGFRPGKVPAQVLEKRFGASVRAEVISDLIENSFRQVLKEQALNPVGTPTIEEVNAQPGSNLEFAAFFEIFPEITLQAFSNYECEQPAAEVTETDIDEMLEQLRKRFSDFKAVERGATLADRVVVDITTTVEGGTPEKQENAYLILEEQTLLPGLVEGFLDKRVEDNVSLDLTYPESWPNKEVAGKPLKIEATIKEVAVRELPNDALLCERLQIDSTDPVQLRARIRENMEQELARAVFEATKEALLEKLLADYNLELPTTLLDQEKKAVEEEAKRHGNLPTEEELNQVVQRRVLLGLLLNEVIKKYELKATPEKIHQQVLRISMNFPEPKNIMRAYYNNKDLLATVERAVLLDEAVHEIAKEAKLIPKSMSYKEVIEGQQNT